MDDISFNPRSTKRVDRERPPGPFGREEVLPKPVSDWKSKVDPPRLRVAESGGTPQRIIESLELHIYDWTIKQMPKARRGNVLISRTTGTKPKQRSRWIARDL